MASRPSRSSAARGKLKFEMRDGKPVLDQAARHRLLRRQGGQAGRHHRHIGRRPIAAFGNSDGDLQMLQWTAPAPAPRYCLLVHHTDAEREWAYDRKSPIGKLDQGSTKPQAQGLDGRDMKNDWNTIYLFQKKK